MIEVLLGVLEGIMFDRRIATVITSSETREAANVAIEHLAKPLGIATSDVFVR